MKTWFKLFETIGVFWLFFCGVPTLIFTISRIVGFRGFSEILMIAVAGTLIWFIGAMFLGFIRNVIGSIWFDGWAEFTANVKGEILISPGRNNNGTQLDRFENAITELTNGIRNK